jgi:hypothetical protein
MAIIRTSSSKVHVSEFQVLYPDQRIVDHHDLTPGSIIEMDGYTLTNGINHKGEVAEYLKDTTVAARLIGFGDVRPPLRCKVTKIITCVTENQPYLIVQIDLEYSKKEQEILKSRYHSFGLGHINRIIHKEPAPVTYCFQLLAFGDVSNMLAAKIQKLDCHNCFDLRAIVEKGVKDGVFHKTKTPCWPFVQAKYSKKRMIAWLKQNINRFKQKDYLMKF